MRTTPQMPASRDSHSSRASGSGPVEPPAYQEPYTMVADQLTLILTPPAAVSRPMKSEPQSADWRDRCRELAWAHGLVGMAQPLGRNQWADLLWHVPSQSQPGTVHTVREARGTGTMHCGCPAGSFSQPCGHVGAVLFESDVIETFLDPREVPLADTSAEYRAWFTWKTGIALEEEPTAE